MSYSPVCHVNPMVAPQQLMVLIDAIHVAISKACSNAQVVTFFPLGKVYGYLWCD
jgi:hypothetical protein